MTRVRYVPLVLLAPVLLGLGACASLGGTPAPADADAIAARVQAVGIAPDLVYVTDLDGFDLATQSVGVMGTDGMSATYTRVDGAAMATVTLSTSRPGDPQPDPAPAPCADLPDADAPVLACQVERGEALVRLDAQGVDPATLRAAGEAVRVPGTAELDAVFADVPEELGPPVERGDLPGQGDGAPLDPTGEGG